MRSLLSCGPTATTSAATDRLLKTKLTELERQFIERRLSEERSAMERLAYSTFPLAFKIPMAVEGGLMENGHI